MAIKQKNVYHRATYGYKLPGYATTEANYLLLSNRSAPEEGDLWYDTTNNLLKTHDGDNWSPAGINSMSAGTLNAVAALGSTITIDGSTVSAGLTITADNSGLSSGALLLLDNDDTSNDPVCLNIDNEADASDAVSIQIDGQAGYDIQGTGDYWHTTVAGVGHFTGVQIGDSTEVISLGGGNDITLSFVDAWSDNADKGLLIASSQSTDQLQIGNSTYPFDVRIMGSTNTNFVLWDASDNQLEFDGCDIFLGDNDELRLGDTSGTGDWVFAWDNSSLKISPIADNSPLLIGTSTYAADVTIYGATASSQFHWISQYDRLVFESAVGSVDPMLMLDDYCQLTFGAGTSLTSTGKGDVQMEWDGTDFHLTPTADGAVWQIGTGTLDFDIKWYGSDTGDYVLFDEGNARVDFVDINLALNDDAILYLGSDRDATLQWDNANSTLDIGANVVITGTLAISAGLDIGAFALTDDEAITFGTDSDFVLQYDGTNANLEIDAAVANDQITFGTNIVTDVRIEGASNDIHWDGSEDTLCFEDNAVLGFGNDAATPDVELKWDASRLCITGTGEEIRIGSSGEGMQVTFYGETVGADMAWFEKNDKLYMQTGSAITLMDNVKLLLGSGTTPGTSAGVGDFSIYSDGTDLFIAEVTAADNNIEIGVDGAGINVIFYGDDSGADFIWDQSVNTLDLQDAAILSFGDGDDLVITSDGTDVTMNFGGCGTDLLMYGDGKKLIIGTTAATNGTDVTFTGTTDSGNVTFDAGEQYWSFGKKGGVTTANNGIDVIFQAHGDTADNAVTFDSGAQTWTFGGLSTDDGIDVIFNGGSEDNCIVKWDAGAQSWTFGTYGGITTANHGIDVIFQAHGDTGDNAVTFDSALQSWTFGGLSTEDGIDVVFQGGSDHNALVTWDAGDQTWYFGKEGGPTTANTGVDVIFQAHGDTGVNAVTFDSSAQSWTFGSVSTDDGIDVVFQGGSDSNATVYFDAGDQSFYFGKEDGPTTANNGIDVVFQAHGDTGVNAVTFDSGAQSWTFGGLSTDDGIDVVFTGGSDHNALITWDAGDQSIYFGKEGGPTTVNNGVDVIFQAHGATGDNAITFDSGLGTWTFGTSNGINGIDVTFQGASDANDTVVWDAGDHSWTFGAAAATLADGVDVVFQGVSLATAAIAWDAGEHTWTSGIGIAAIFKGDTTQATITKGLAIPTVSAAPTTCTANVVDGTALICFLQEGDGTSGTLYVKPGTTQAWLAVDLT